jgi:hypothetical protein
MVNKPAKRNFIFIRNFILISFFVNRDGHFSDQKETHYEQMQERIFA